MNHRMKTVTVISRELKSLNSDPPRRPGKGLGSKTSSVHATNVRELLRGIFTVKNVMLNDI